MADDSQSCNFMHKIKYGDKFLYSFFSILLMSFFVTFYTLVCTYTNVNLDETTNNYTKH